MKHAKVKRDGFIVPLIGIPEEAVQEICSICKETVHMEEMKLGTDGVLICKKCATLSAKDEIKSENKE